MTQKYQPDVELNSGQCLTEDQLDNYICKMLSSQETLFVEKHLNDCNTCFQKLVTILKVTFSPTTAHEQKELNRILPVTIDEQVSKILTYNCELNPNRTEKRLLNRLVTYGFNFIRRYFLTTTPRWRPVVAYAFLVLLAVGILGGYPLLSRAYHLTQAKSLLEQNYQIDIENDLQLAGEFAPGMGKLMASDDSENREAYLASSRRHLRAILNDTPNHVKASVMLAKIFIIERKFAQAESIFTELQKRNVTSAPLLNDMAIFVAEKGDTGLAINLLESAIKIDAQLPEPYYNVGYLLNKIKPDSGRNFHQKYLELEKDPRWQEVIQTE